MRDKDFPDLTSLIGMRVIRRDSDDSEQCEVGIIIHAWKDSEVEVTDCYVAFFGQSWPSIDEKPDDKPYVLRYFLSTLEKAD